MKRMVILTTAMLLLLVVSVVLASTAMPSPAATNQQNLLPTATYLPIDESFSFDFTRVNLSDDPILFDDQQVDGISVTDFSYVTRYPEGLAFTATITGTDFESVTLVYRFPNGNQGRVAATPTEKPDEWQAVAFDTRGLPPWMTLDVFWRINIGGELIETAPVNVEYIDHTREWYRVESEDAIVYWFDFSEELGAVVMEAFFHVRDRYLVGFGELEIKPRVVIFPPGDLMGEWQAGGQINPRTTGLLQSQSYASVLRIRGLEIEDIRKDCIWNEPRDEEWQMRYSASVATHEVAHLYQHAFFGGRGPTWWIEGSATFFELEMGPVDQRLRNLAAMGEDIPTLQFGGPSGMVGLPAVDGCTHLGYEIGASFINYFVNNYGGYEALAEVIDLLSQAIGIEDAMEQVSGMSFAEMERQWRMYLGFDPDPYIMPTPAFQFPPTVTPFGQ